MPVPFFKNLLAFKLELYISNTKNPENKYNPPLYIKFTFESLFLNCLFKLSKREKKGSNCACVDISKYPLTNTGPSFLPIMPPQEQ